MSRARAFLIVTLVALAMLPAPAGLLAGPQGGSPSAAPEAGTPDGAGIASQTYTIRYRNVDDVYLLLSPYLGPRGSIRSQPHQKTLTVTDTPANLARMAEMVAGYDVPPRSVQVSVQLILASSGQASSDPPPPIRGVIEKLNALNTRWNDYRLVGDARVMGTEGEHSSLRVGDDYRVDFRIDQISEEGRVIRFKPFELAHRESAVEGNERYASIMSTVLNLRDAQLFIVGASKMERSNRALFMTITASLQPQ